MAIETANLVQAAASIGLVGAAPAVIRNLGFASITFPAPGVTRLVLEQPIDGDEVKILATGRAGWLATPQRIDASTIDVTTVGGLGVGLGAFDLEVQHLPTPPGTQVTPDPDPLAPPFGSTNVGWFSTCYVDPVKGSDATGLRGRHDRPFKTLAAGFAAALAGDNIQLAAGSYAAAINWPALDGITLLGQGAETTIIDGGAFAAITMGAVGVFRATVVGVTLRSSGGGIAMTAFGPNATHLADGLVMRDVVLDAAQGIQANRCGRITWEQVNATVGDNSFQEVADLEIDDSQARSITVRYDDTQPLPAAPLLGAFLRNHCQIGAGGLRLQASARVTADRTTEVAAKVTGDALAVGGIVGPPLCVFAGTAGGIDFGSAPANYLPGAGFYRFADSIITGAIVIETVMISAPGLFIDCQRMLFYPAAPSSFAFGNAFPNSLININIRGGTYPNQAIFATTLGCLDRDVWSVPGVLLAPGVPTPVPVFPPYAPGSAGAYVVTATETVAAAGDTIEDTGPHLDGGSTLTLLALAPGPARPTDVVYQRFPI